MSKALFQMHLKQQYFHGLDVSVPSLTLFKLDLSLKRTIFGLYRTKMFKNLNSNVIEACLAPSSEAASKLETVYIRTACCTCLWDIWLFEFPLPVHPVSAFKERNN